MKNVFTESFFSKVGAAKKLCILPSMWGITDELLVDDISRWLFH
jgi:hypothetical protein